jgi:Uma2 family endonuclease
VKIKVWCKIHPTLTLRFEMWGFFCRKLSLGVERFVEQNGRSSYVLWEEDNIPPIFALEIVSQTYNSEYEQKKISYAELGVLFREPTSQPGDQQQLLLSENETVSPQRFPELTVHIQDILPLT